MEIAQFFKQLLRYKKILIAIPLLSMIAAFLLVRNLPDKYTSATSISTGLVARTDAFINNSNNIQESKISQEFSNIIEMMQMKKVINQLTYQLMIHDLSGKEAPYRELSKKVLELTPAQRQEAIAVFSQKYAAMEELPLSEKKGKDLQKLAASMKYDYESIREKLNVYRVQTSDFIQAKFTSENPLLSTFVLNFLTKEFISYYTAGINRNKDAALRYLDSSIQVKQASLNNRMAALKNYKINNRVLDVNQQASVLMSQIADFQSRRQEALKNISAYSGALRNINSKLDPKERQSIENTLTQSNQDITITRNRLNTVNDEYIRSGFDAKLKPRIDSLQSALTNHINQANDRTTFNTSVAKQDLVKEKMEYEVQLEIAKNSVGSLNSEVNNLSGRLNVLAPNQANIQSFEKEIETESKEYADLVNKLNQTKLESSFPVRLQQVEPAVPEAPEPARRLLLVLLAGVVSFLICVGVLFILFYLDKTINDVSQLEDRTGLPVIGTITTVPGAVLNPQQVWGNSTEAYSDLRNLKSGLRA